jgi:hypothetical protein
MPQTNNNTPPPAQREGTSQQERLGKASLALGHQRERKQGSHTPSTQGPRSEAQVRSKKKVAEQVLHAGIKKGTVKPFALDTGAQA